MKKFSKKGVLLFAAAMALCAFAMPSMASAATWGPALSHHALHSSNLGFVNDANGAQSMCTTSTFTANVTAGQSNLEITAATFSGCTLAAPLAGATHCVADSTGTNFPWTATAVTTSNIQIHGVNIDVFLTSSGTCPAPLGGNTIKITGTLSSGRWTGNGAGQHQVEIAGATGVVSHLPAASGGGTTPITTTGTIGDTSLTVG